MEKVCAHIKLTLQTYNKSQHVHLGTILILMCFRFTDKDFYNKIAGEFISAQEILNHIEKTLPKDFFISSDTEKLCWNAVYEVARVIVAYNVDESKRQREILIKGANTDENSKEELLIKPDVIPHDSLQEAINHYCKNLYHGNDVVPFCLIIQHIELLTSFR